MSTLEARIAEVIAGHQLVGISLHEDAHCAGSGCGWTPTSSFLFPTADHRAHVAQMLAPAIREAQADLVDVLADLIDDTQNGHDIAECAAYTPGETGRQNVIDAWEELIEEPADWLRKKAAEHRGHERDHVQELLFDAWQSGCEEAMDAAGYAPGPRNAMYDRNPYRPEVPHASNP